MSPAAWNVMMLSNGITGMIICSVERRAAGSRWNAKKSQKEQIAPSSPRRRLRSRRPGLRGASPRRRPRRSWGAQAGPAAKFYVIQGVRGAAVRCWAGRAVHARRLAPVMDLAFQVYFQASRTRSSHRKNSGFLPRARGRYTHAAARTRWATRGPSRTTSSSSTPRSTT